VIVVAVRVHVKAGKREEFIKLAQGMLEPSRDEKGCISYNFYADTQDANAFIYFEEWESGEALRQHTRSGHYSQYADQVPAVLERPAEVRVYTVSKVELR
jgi:quinol monooxygenase YgiN